MIIFLYGDNEYDAKNKLEEIKLAFKRKVDKTGSNIFVVEGDEFDFNDWREKFMSPALFAKERMIIVKDLLGSLPKQDLQNQIINLLEQDNDNVVVFWEKGLDSQRLKKVQNQPLFKFLSQQKYVYHFAKPTGARLNQWIIKSAQAKGADIEMAAVNLLVSIVGDDLWRLQQELDKLALYGDGTITKQTVLEMVEEVVGDEIWGLVDAIARGNKPLALQMLRRQFRQGTDWQEIFNKIAWQLRVLLMVKTASDKLSSPVSYELAKQLDLHSFVVKKALAVVRYFSTDKLRQLYQKLLDLEIELKKSKVNPEVLLSRFILDI